MTGHEGDGSLPWFLTGSAQRIGDRMAVRRMDFTLQCGVGPKESRCPLAATTSVQCLGCRHVLGSFYCDYHAAQTLKLPKALASHRECQGSGEDLFELSGLLEAGWLTWAP